MIQLHAQTTIALISLTTVTALAYWYYNLEKKDNKSEDDKPEDDQPEETKDK